MMYYTHLAFGLLVSLVSIVFFNINNKIIFIFIAMFFSLFPDIDETKSRIGKKHKILSTIFKLFFGHRGIIHSIYIPILIFIVLIQVNIELGYAVLLGYTSHLLLDASTRSGIRPLTPLFNFKLRGILKTNAFFEKILFLIIIIADIFVLLIYI